VDRVSWSDAVEFCRKLSTQEGHTYRLPTEAEWEYACRAGSTTRFHFGDDGSQLDQYAWYVSNPGDGTHPVGQLRPNAFGLYDMHGNVWEWCADRYGKDYYSKSPPEHPAGPSTGDRRLLRGGSFNHLPTNGRSANRDSDQPTKRADFIGFRPARTYP